MSFSTMAPPTPLWWAPMREGETDSRSLDCTADLGRVGDSIQLAALSVAIIRHDGNPMTGADLQLAGSAWPNSVDSTGLIVTLGLTAPVGSAGQVYRVTLTVNHTVMGRVFIRDVFIQVVPTLG
jgi:hypothetical protein